MKGCISLSSIIAAILILTGCDEWEKINPLNNKDILDSTINYVIPSGAHYAKQSSYQSLKTNRIRFKATFDSSAIYQTAGKNNQGNINKLYGMSDCDSHHQVNSARFGWRWYNNQLEIWAYTYANKQRQYKFINTVDPGVDNVYEITFTGNAYIFRLNDSSVELPRSCNEEASGYKLYPYFGGDEPAPHEITIKIEDLP